MARLTIEDILSKQFIESDNGYDKEDVDTFLDTIIDEMDTLIKERDNFRTQLNALQAQKKAEPAPVAPAAPATPVKDTNEKKRVVDLLEMAERLQEEVLAKADEEANAIRTRATAEAAETLQGLEKQKTQLTDEVAALKKVALEYRGKFEQLLQAQQDALDKATELF